MPNLPFEVLRDRVKNEIALCQRKLKHIIIVEDPEVRKFPLKIKIIMDGIPGPWLRDGKVTSIFHHEFTIDVTKEYPYQKPIVRWATPIYHPNIMLPDDGGYVCTKLLENWNFSSNLLAFIKGIESLLANPNPRNPYGSESCTSAASYFNKHPYKPPAMLESQTQPPKIGDRPKIKIITPGGK